MEPRYHRRDHHEGERSRSGHSKQFVVGGDDAFRDAPLRFRSLRRCRTFEVIPQRLLHASCGTRVSRPLTRKRSSQHSGARRKQPSGALHEGAAQRHARRVGTPTATVRAVRRWVESPVKGRPTRNMLAAAGFLIKTYGEMLTNSRGYSALLTSASPDS